MVGNMPLRGSAALAVLTGRPQRPQNRAWRGRAVPQNLQYNIVSPKLRTCEVVLASVD
jgi:hypothetical protein